LSTPRVNHVNHIFIAAPSSRAFFHPSYQQIAMLDTETGELWEGRREHEQGEARRFYESLAGPVRLGQAS